jgi:hypothetical protein
MMISPAERIWSRHAEGCPNEIKCEAIVVYREHVQMLSWLAVWESYLRRPLLDDACSLMQCPP